MTHVNNITVTDFNKKKKKHLNNRDSTQENVTWGRVCWIYTSYNSQHGQISNKDHILVSWKQHYSYKRSTVLRTENCIKKRWVKHNGLRFKSSFHSFSRSWTHSFSRVCRNDQRRKHLKTAHSLGETTNQNHFTGSCYSLKTNASLRSFSEALGGLCP